MRIGRTQDVITAEPLVNPVPAREAAVSEPARPRGETPPAPPRPREVPVPARRSLPRR